MALTKEQAAAFDKILSDPEAPKKKAFEEWKQEHPDGPTDAFEQEWGPIALVFGL